MGIQFDSNGLVIQNLSEILDERENTCRPILGNDFVISGESAVANLQAVDADREEDIQELFDLIENNGWKGKITNNRWILCRLK